ncbi:hypothetical protein [Thalassorhabdomicrobium marinisediminis]|uniref:Glycosyltransferase n=1 Tax=Thalassorhabdomicrobium marinisediminis TaxID=2170577 RepID=A0A2T7FX01_9RHOB|nr:hypothetical protein [Thalassorhabdomicrobium marinisediminis]PVA06705.1 hypothetical protein DC363_09250 [Thalassorhabdomicrobium marinisediminis]
MTQTTPERAILSIKWGREFDPQDLNVLKRAALDHLSQPVRFICLTDDGEGLDPDIEVHPIPAFDFYADTPGRGVWPKISLFHPDLVGLADIFLFLDIDMVVTGPLDGFFEDPGQTLRMLSCGDRWRQMDEGIEPQAATAAITYRPELHIGIFEEFQRNKEHYTSTITLEQQFVGQMAKDLSFYPVEWVQSFKYHLRRPYLVDLFLPPRDPAPSTRLVAFHGFPRPRAVVEPIQPWARPPRSGRKPPKWLTTYWKRYSR